jgi:hypothetical protein
MPSGGCRLDCDRYWLAQMKGDQRLSWQHDVPSLIGSGCADRTCTCARGGSDGRTLPPPAAAPITAPKMAPTPVTSAVRLP